jgi:PAS domain S-box-containing protein
MPEERAAIERHFASITPWQPLGTIENRIIMPDGTSRWHEWTNHAIFGEDGEVIEMQSVGRDITRRKEAEFIVKEQLHFLHELINRIPIPLFIKDIECRYIGCNKAYSDYTGQSVEYMTGKTVFEVFPGDLAADYHRHDLAVFNNQSEEQYITEIITADGTRREIFVNKAPFYTCNGLVGGIVGVMLDITEETRTRKKYQMLYSQIPHPIMCLQKNAEGSDYRITSANTAFSDLFEFYPSNLKDKILRNIFPAITPEITGRFDHALETASIEKIVCHLQDGMPGMGLLAIPLGERELSVFIVSNFID